MGRRGRGGGRGQRGGRRDSGGQQQRDGDRYSKTEFVDGRCLDNPAFNEYYQTLGVVPPGEWDAFVACLRTSLPTTFRINGSGRFAGQVRDKLQTDFFSHFAKGPVVLDGEEVPPPRPLPWYPDALAWQLNFSRAQLRKLPLLANIHAWMKTANEAGVISRQEAVSMVPPLFMDVEPHHRVLDMCAAPGSKTFQLLEALHASRPPPGGGPAASSDPTGFVVANDADGQRCHLLVHQTKRMCSPCLMVTNHSAEVFPFIHDPAAKRTRRPPRAAAAAAGGSGDGGGDVSMRVEGEAEGEEGDEEEGEAEAAVGDEGGAGNGASAGGVGLQRGGRLLYDRVLCDVPCSGDGTMRKSPDIWRRWSVNNGNGLHGMQLRIALQAARLLKVGGRLVYSTCTFNPIEDEAVVAELILRTHGALQLVDMSDHLPQLRRVAGLTQWRVRDKYRWYSTWEEAEPVSHKLHPTMFSTPEKAALPLDRCMRFLPHHQDTGGFFVAVLEKVKPCGPIPTPNTVHRFAKPGQEGLTPLAGAQRAAEAALAAARRALEAVDAGDGDAAREAAATAAAAAARCQMALDAERIDWGVNRRERGGGGGARGRGRGRGGRGGRGEGGGAEEAAEGAAAAGQEEAGAKAGGDVGPMDVDAPEGREEEAAVAAAAADAVDAADADEAAAAADAADADEAAAAAAAADAADSVRAPSTAGDDDGASVAAPSTVGDADATDAGAAAAAAAPAWVPSWVRGGGGATGRGQTEAGRYRGADPIAPVEDPAILDNLTEFYGIEPRFPLRCQLITRSLEAALPKRLYFVSTEVLGLLLADEREQLKITATGLKLFERHELRSLHPLPGELSCTYRIAQEGLPFLLPHLTEQVLYFQLSDFLRLVRERNLPLGQRQHTPATPAVAAAAPETDGAPATTGAPLAAAAAPANGYAGKTRPNVEEARGAAGGAQAPLDSPDALEQLSRMRLGGGVCVLRPADAAALGLPSGEEAAGGLSSNAPLALSVWRTRASLSALMNKAECQALVEKVEAAVAKAKAAS